MCPLSTLRGFMEQSVSQPAGSQSSRAVARLREWADRGMSEVRNEQDRLRADGVLDKNGDRIVLFAAPMNDMGLNHDAER
jgi:hypothetical protein